MSKRPFRIALVGSGFMGRAHAMAFNAVGRTFDLPVEPVLELIADRDAETAAAAAASLGFNRSTGNWRAAVADPEIDLVAIATPNLLHAPIALAAIAAGKPVYCEKPLATTLDEARAMTESAEIAGLPTAVGFTYLYNPMIEVAREIVASGEIGRITAFRGIHAEDFMASPDAPFNWRCEQDQAGGALADIGSHIIAMARHVVGEVDQVCGQLDTAHTERRDPAGVVRAVGVDDQMDALVRFDGGASGVLSASWMATGRKMGLSFEVNGTKGSIYFTQERFNELQLYREGGTRLEGFTTIMAGPQHGDYGAFCPAGGHQIGYNDLKTIEVKAAIEAALGMPNKAIGFRAALRVDRIAHAIRQSSASGGWVTP